MGTPVGPCPGCGEMEKLDNAPIYGGFLGYPPMKVGCHPFSLTSQVCIYTILWFIVITIPIKKPNPVMVRPSCLHATLRFLLHDDFPIFLHVAFLLLVACAPKLGLPLQIQVFPQNISLSKKILHPKQTSSSKQAYPQQPTSFNFFPIIIDEYLFVF